MKVTNLIEQIEGLKQQIDVHGKLPEEVLKKVNYKFRLDWNYYSNRMEGGTLTRDETRSVMIGNVSVEGKPLKDVLEMNGHDEVVREILNIGSGKSRLSEKRIIEVHKAIIKEDNDPDKKRQIGNWKEQPNEIINYKGEKINFTSPEEVQEEMHRLLNRTNADLDAFFNKKKDAKHPLFIASDFHVDYVSIHPFFDGNGRTARIFTNLILISCGYPPVVIKDEEKEGYYKTLADIQAYGGDREFFYDLMGKVLLRSTRLVLDAIEGKDLEEPGDLEKRLQLLKQLAEAEDEETIKLTNRQIKSKEVLYEIIAPVSKSLLKPFRKVAPLFSENYFKISINSKGGMLQPQEDLEDFLISHFSSQSIFDGSDLNEYKLELGHQYFKKGGVNAFHVWWEAIIRFESTRFEVYINRSNQPAYKKLYHQIVSTEEVNSIAEGYLKYILDEIDRNLEQINSIED
ncbi:Fic family protein [Antarcticibacterium sp. 1MA-6-2]|uniref:Fic family protein n=1 Tax=Antarcticibacterium sp. 1MA-6-2 TaxID=2908210 RepID=UPI001F2C5AB4|nr:Fic family protein [Antarcticibacterium sp. 1MA-6-2]UJH90562.1 Fic family protein [Antarcticibacterium sp. 1MA-6-2]